jgi:3-hydroxyisobutyrate dehydrogenase
VLESVGAGAAGSWTLANLAPRMLKGDFAPGFRIEHFVKDLGIALEVSEQAGLNLPGTALAHQTYKKAMETGLADRGTHALALVHPSPNSRN